MQQTRNVLIGFSVLCAVAFLLGAGGCSSGGLLSGGEGKEFAGRVPANFTKECPPHRVVIRLYEGDGGEAHQVAWVRVDLQVTGFEKQPVGSLVASWKAWAESGDWEGYANPSGSPAPDILTFGVWEFNLRHDRRLNGVAIWVRYDLRVDGTLRIQVGNPTLFLDHLTVAGKEPLLDATLKADEGSSREILVTVSADHRSARASVRR